MGGREGEGEGERRGREGERAREREGEGGGCTTQVLQRQTRHLHRRNGFQDASCAWLRRHGNASRQRRYPYPGHAVGQENGPVPSRTFPYAHAPRHAIAAVTHLLLVATGQAPRPSWAGALLVVAPAVGCTVKFCRTVPSRAGYRGARRLRDISCLLFADEGLYLYRSSALWRGDLSRRAKGKLAELAYRRNPQRRPLSLRRSF